MQKAVVMGLMAGMAGWLWAGVTPVSPDQEKALIDWLVPRPHEVAISNAVTVKPADVAVRLCPDAGAIEKQALAELEDLFQARAGKVPAGAAFEIVIGVLNAQGRVGKVAVAGAERLKALPNKDQAYLIQPEGAHRLVVAGLTAKGVYYGVQTLKQLLESKMTKEQVAIPLAVITDWPDMEERGMWNQTLDSIPWISTLKMNFLNIQTSFKFEKDKPAKAPFNQAYLTNELVRAMTGVIKVNHLNYWDQLCPLYKLYPDMAGKGAQAVPDAKIALSRTIILPCMSNPLWKKMIGEVLSDVASQGARDVSVWLSEHTGQCQCADCLKSTQVQMETRIVMEAWQEARKQYPDLELRIFFSFSDKASAYEDCLASLPPEVKIERVQGLHKPFLDAAARGRWVDSYDGPDISASEMRFYGTKRFQETLKQRYAQQIKGVFSMGGSGLKIALAPGCFRNIFDYPVSALAEWSWNVNGRSRREFVQAWATRQGYNAPEKVPDWAETVEGVAEELSQPLPYGVWTPLAPLEGIGDRIRQQKKLLGFSPEQIAQWLARCQRVLPLAESFNKPDLAIETRHLVAGLKTLEAVNELSGWIAPPNLAGAAGKQKAQEACSRIKSAVNVLILTKSEQVDVWQGQLESNDFSKITKSDYQQRWQKITETIDQAVSDLLKGIR